MSTESAEVLPLASIINGSSTDSVAVSTVVVSPFTIKSPVTVKAPVSVPPAEVVSNFLELS